MTFQFYDGRPPNEGDSAILQVPPGISSKEVLLKVIDDGLQFPDYFGGNWDAFEECIRDLGWLQASRVEIVHRDIPLAAYADEAGVYLRILHDAVARWGEHGQRRLVVWFPCGDRDRVEWLLGGSRGIL
jgi:hypothetical protein